MCFVQKIRVRIIDLHNQCSSSDFRKFQRRMRRDAKYFKDLYQLKYAKYFCLKTKIHFFP